MILTSRLPFELKMAKGMKANPAAVAAQYKQKRLAEEKAAVELDNEEDIEELKRLVEEARGSRPKDVKKKLKKQQQRSRGGEDEDDQEGDDDDEGRGALVDDDEDEEEDADLSDEERVLRELKAERARGDDDDEEDGEEDEDDDGELQQQRLPNDAAGMRSLADELRLKDFAEALVVSDEQVFTEKINPEDDKLREARFVEIAKRSVEAGRAELDKLKVPHRRPTDFMAEMIKSDDHMARVKRRLLFEQQKMKVVEARKAAQRNKKRQKEIKKQRDEERVSRKRQAAELASSFRDKNPGDDDDGKKSKRARTGSKGSGKKASKQRPGKAKRKSSKGRRK